MFYSFLCDMTLSPFPVVPKIILIYNKLSVTGLFLKVGDGTHGGYFWLLLVNQAFLLMLGPEEVVLPECCDTAVDNQSYPGNAWVFRVALGDAWGLCRPELDARIKSCLGVQDMYPNLCPFSLTLTYSFSNKYG